MLEYINNPNVAFINVLSEDSNAMWSCTEWGSYGIEGFPIIVDDLDDYFMHTIGDWFGVSWTSPRHIFIDHEFKYYAITDDLNVVEDIIDEMLLEISNGE